jgi:predicted alpha-1,6-mannanase (GH76 family)
MEYVIFILLLIFLVAALLLIRKLDTRTKNKHRQEAYNLLKNSNASAREIKETLKGLQLYGGRWRRNKEFAELIRSLSDKLNNVKE